MISIDKNGVITRREMTEEERAKELERQRHYAAHNKASALGHARREAYREAEEKWQGVVAEKDTAHVAALADKDAQIAKLLARLGENK